MSALDCTRRLCTPVHRDVCTRGHRASSDAGVFTANEPVSRAPIAAPLLKIQLRQRSIRQDSNDDRETKDALSHAQVFDLTLCFIDSYRIVGSLRSKRVSRNFPF